MNATGTMAKGSRVTKTNQGGVEAPVAGRVARPLGVRRRGIDRADVTTPSQLELYSWWVNPGETDALAALLNVYKEAHPQTNVINATVGGTVAARAQLRDRMIAGSPPDTFQALGGWNLMEWVLYNGRDDGESKMEPVDDLANQAEFTRRSAQGPFGPD